MRGDILPGESQNNEDSFVNNVSTAIFHLGKAVSFYNDRQSSKSDAKVEVRCAIRLLNNIFEEGDLDE